MVRYILDKDFNLLKVTRSLSGILWTCAKWVIATASLAAFYYLIFSLVINTDEEKRLKQENRLYEKLYPEMEQKEKLISDVVKDLQARDDAIYLRIRPCFSLRPILRKTRILSNILNAGHWPCWT